MECWNVAVDATQARPAGFEPATYGLEVHCPGRTAARNRPSQLASHKRLTVLTKLIAEPMGKVSWTKHCVAGGSGLPVELDKR